MMRAFELTELCQVLEAHLRGENRRVGGVVTDTRQLQPGELFVALRGPNFDGHDFVAEAERKGAGAVVVNRPLPTALPQLVVSDTLKALGRLGGYNRALFRAPVFAVTGSCGKTTVKEMLARLLASGGKVLATHGNLNNEVGVPLTLLQLAPEHEAAVIELGASAPGEIARTAAMTRPDVALVNNAMGAHLEGFGGLAGVVRAKGEIFTGLPEGGVGVVNLDSPHAPAWIERLQQLGRRMISFGVENGAADVNASKLEMNPDGSWRFVLEDGTERLPVALKLLGRHNVANATAAVAAWVAAGRPLSKIAGVLEQCRPVAGRLSPHTLANGALLIDDSYNANADAVKAAIDLLAQLPGHRVLVLGEMAELGEQSAPLHAEVGRYAAERQIDQLLAVGPATRAAVAAYAALKPGGEHFPSQARLIDQIQALPPQRLTLLVKGSRSAAMDRVVAALLEGGN
ncbi:MAG: UDP-N-acetylmuramoyl-tripeptide--D-alanyl-D-alanine ligase [Pseudomonadota bacterium]|jgi:UDP-N-acetylmuramoyl-tripeptide--D-alanyl-D-alanine ligase|nr:UDP-N-acetylmuramoyl-tripeptide--D-alanyl-D-alanine ligase [Pseudomonadota bacterium]